MGAAEPEVSVENFLVVPGVDKPPKKKGVLEASRNSAFYMYVTFIAF